MEEPKDEDTNLSQRLLEPHIDDALMTGEIVVDPLQAAHGQRGENQTAQYRDTPFALAFLAQLAVIFFLAIFWGFASLRQKEEETTDNTDENDTVSLWGFFCLLFLVSSASLAIASATLDFMTNHAEHLMQASLIGSCIILGVVVLLLFSNDSPSLGFCWLFVLICTGLYAYSVQRRIPFASANLKTALSAIQTNYGVCIVAYAVAAMANLWVVLWFLAILGVAFRSSSCSDGSCDMAMNHVVFLLMLLSFYWTSQVFQVRMMDVVLSFLCFGNTHG